MARILVVDDEPGGDRTPAKEFVGRLFEATKKRGLLIGKGGLYGNVFRIAPALTVTPTYIDECLRILGESFEEVRE